MLQGGEFVIINWILQNVKVGRVCDNIFDIYRMLYEGQLLVINRILQ